MFYGFVVVPDLSHILNLSSLLVHVQVGGSQIYKVDRKLCKVGFRQVFVGGRVSGGSERAKVWGRRGGFKICS